MILCVARPIRSARRSPPLWTVRQKPKWFLSLRRNSKVPDERGMTASKPLDHELPDAELDLQAQRWAEQAEARSRQKAILDARKKEWRNAPPQASGLKPFSDLWRDIQAQRRGAITEASFWAQAVRTIHEGFFDQEHRLLYVVDDETRITSETLKPALHWNEDGQRPMPRARYCARQLGDDRDVERVGKAPTIRNPFGVASRV